MKTQRGTETPQITGRHRFAATTALVLGTLTAVLGVWALVAPQSFATTIAPFTPYNAHYLHDLGAFQLGIGMSLLLAASGGDGLPVALGGYAVGGASHTLAHLIDRNHGGHPADAPLLGVLVVLALIALALRKRARSAPDGALVAPPTAVASAPSQGGARVRNARRRAITGVTGGERQSAAVNRLPRGAAGRQRYAFAVLWLALLGQVFWMLGQYLATRSPGDKALYDSAIVATFAAFAATRGRVRWLASVLRILTGLIFLGSVGDRFGLLGPPGTPGVSWGDLAHFVDYTRTVNAFLPASWAATLAGLATLGETALGLALLLGVRPRLTAGGAATLLLLFGAAMTLSLGFAAPFPYAVWVLAAGAWTLVTIDASVLGLGARLARWASRRRLLGARPDGARTAGVARDGQ